MISAYQVLDLIKQNKYLNDFQANPEERSPSPEPVYSSDGKRLNTRDVRTRRKLEDMRHKAIQEMKEINPHYMPPADYKVSFD